MLHPGCLYTIIIYSICTCKLLLLSKLRKPWFDDECSKLVDRRNQARLRWLQDPSGANEGNLNDVRRQAGIHFTNKKGNI
jgi:hypothetical protein